MKLATLIGRKIVGVVKLTDKQLQEFGWYEPAFGLRLDNGEVLVPARDEELNGPGHFLLLD